MNSDVIRQLQPAILWNFFADISAIPRISKHEEAVIAYIMDQALKRGLQASRDGVGNLLVRKPATPGLEQADIIVLQSHLDMVPQKVEGSAHDFKTDPIRLVVDDNWVRAQDTTLGADNGIGVAAMLAVLMAEDLRHGPIEALFTIDEEAGMTGAAGLSQDWLKGRRLLNLDTEEEGEVYLGCAGGIDIAVELPLEREPAAEGYAFYVVHWHGLRGGHSGIDIHRGRGNAIKIAARMLLNARHDFDIRVVELSGGTLRNAIPRHARAVIAVPKDYAEEFCQYLNAQCLATRLDLQLAEDRLELDCRPTDKVATFLTSDCQQKLLHALYECPHGVMQMSSEFDGVVHTSNNLASLTLDEYKARWQCLLRSLDDRKRDQSADLLIQLAAQRGAVACSSGAYPGWIPQADSPLLTVAQQVHQSLFSVPARQQVIHAGLECGLLSQKYPHMEMISFGPTIRGAHSPDERVDIESVGKFWRYLVTLLSRLAAE